MWIIASIDHFSIKFPTPNGTCYVRVRQEDSKECYDKDIIRFQKKGDSDQIKELTHYAARKWRMKRVWNH